MRRPRRDDDDDDDADDVARSVEAGGAKNEGYKGRRDTRGGNVGHTAGEGGSLYLSPYFLPMPFICLPLFTGAIVRPEDRRGELNGP